MNIAELPKVKKVNINHLPVMAKRQIANVDLPANYLAAKEALKRCDSVDEVKDISDKHTAIAHYAKQIKDDSLRYYAQRVYLRAMRRIGELVLELKGSVTQKEISSKYGISQWEMDRAVNISYAPSGEFEGLVEKTPPASTADAVQAGWRKSPHGLRTMARYAEHRANKTGPCRELSAYELFSGTAKDILDLLEDAGPECCHLSMTVGSKYRIDVNGVRIVPSDAMRWAQMLAPDEAEKVRPMVLLLIEWLDDFERGLSREGKQ